MSNLILGPIIGGLTSTSANLWGRCDGEGVLHAWIGNQPDLTDAVLVSHSLPLNPNDGFCGVAPLRNLSPNTHYHYTLSLDESPPSPSQGPYPEFTTFPAEGQPVSFNFAFGSCFLPKDAHSGEIFKRIEEYRQQEHLRFWLLIGDQIYADDAEHNGIGKISVTMDDYRWVYHYAWSRPIMQKLLANFPAFMIMDDHDVEDDWCWIDLARLTATIPWWNRIKRRLNKIPLEERQFPRQRVLNALQTYWEHQAMHAPPLINSPPLELSGRYDLTSAQTGGLDYSFAYGAAAFYVLDTRTQRIKHRRQRIMLSEAQWRSFEQWLIKVKNSYPVKFIVSSGAVLYRFFFDIPADRWSGFPKERDRLLELLARHGVEGVYILTGDLHAAHAMRAELPGPQGQILPLWEFCSTPFEQQPNRTSGLLYNPFRFWQLKDLKLIGRVAANNFGLIRVNFTSSGKPQVIFEIYGEDGQLLGRAGD
jgi:phosphodiesterase/alkaline phosphatase D-like protein